MLTRLLVKNFKRFENADIPLGEAVVFVGANNAGKTTALQALGLWNLGVRRLAERHGDKAPPETRPGVAINRKDLLALPVPDASQLWHTGHASVGGERRPIEILVEGVTEGVAWSFGVEFRYVNSESLRCRPLQESAHEDSSVRTGIPAAASQVRLAFLPPMSGLMSNETKLEPGAVAVRIGEGRTAEVLRNLCYRVFADDKEGWKQLRARIQSLFGAELNDPIHLVERGEIEMSYVENGATLDLSCSGRGLQQTLLLLAYMQANPGAVLLFDEPDAHLEVLRQRLIYEVLTTVARETSSQIIAASHSEVLLQEAGDRDMVVAFVGKPHRIDDRGSQVLKALREIGFDNYYQAERKGWVLYVEGSTDLAILRAFARSLSHPAESVLEEPFVHAVGNQMRSARYHFYGLREARKDLAGIAILDRDAECSPDGALREMTWRRREIENYLGLPEVLYEYAERKGAAEAVGPLFTAAEGSRRRTLMESIVRDQVPPAALRDPAHRYWQDTKVSDVLLDPVFEEFFSKLSLPDLMRKTNYHQLATFVPVAMIDNEVVDKLDAIVATAKQARPVGP